ncbi:MAG: hypothetical protein EOO38_06850 [Cytophagaceae bacterium]|nr:MAG: hypothetical protein EOO38_06850 [Cytophagaceae bacterium]
MTDYICPPNANHLSGKSRKATSGKIRENQEVQQKRPAIAQDSDNLQKKARKGSGSINSEQAISSVLKPPSSDDQNRMNTIKKLPGVLPESVRIEGNLIVATNIDGSPLTHTRAAHAKDLSARIEKTRNEDRRQPGPLPAEALSMVTSDSDFLDEKYNIW